MKMSDRKILCGFIACLVMFAATQCSAMEVVRAKKINEPEKEYVGKILIEDAAGGFMLIARDGKITQFTADDVISREMNDDVFVPYTKNEISELLLKEFGPNFKTYTVGPYVIVYNTSLEYVKWCAALLDRHYEKFREVWSGFGLKLQKPEFPLVVVLLENKAQFKDYGRSELGDGFISEMNAYYHLMTNRVVLCDLTGIESGAQSGKRATAAMIRKITTRPRAGYNISAIMHEASHQIGFNTGMFQRFAPTPLWLLEGIAMMHELPDIHNPKQTESGEPKVNKERLRQLNGFINADPILKSNPYVRIQSMLESDDLIRNKNNTALMHYGLSWSICYYLYKKKPKEFSQYLQIMTSQQILDEYPVRNRVDDFEKTFGNNREKFSKDYMKFIKSL